MADFIIPPSERIQRAILCAEQKEWSEFFEAFRQQTYTKLRSAKTETERIEIQQNVKAFDLVEATFKQIREK